MHLTPHTPHSLRRVVVTGAAGFIGSHLSHALLEAGTTVIGVDRRDPQHDPEAAADWRGARPQPA